MARPWPISAGFSLCVGGALALAFACNAGDLTLPASSEPAAVTGLQGNSQTAIVGGTLPESLVVRVTDTRQLPIPQIRVAFVLMTPTAGGSVAPDTTTTDQEGRAAARWTLGPQAGPQQAEARIVGNDQLKATFTATASAGSVASFVIVKGDKQRAPAGSVLPDSLVVRALDGQSNPIPGVLVNWTVTGGGSVSTDQVPTGADGRAAVRRTLGPAAGAQTTVANAGNVPGSPLTFTTTAAAGEAAALVLVTQPASVASAGSQLARQPRVQLSDHLGNPIGQAGVTVTAELGSGPAATLTGDRTQPTDASGIATFTDLAISGPPGSYTLRFTGQGLPPILSDAIDLRTGAPSPSRSNLTADPGTITVFGNKSSITVTVRDAQGNPIGGATVLPSSNDPGTSSFAPASASTNDNGVATFAFGASAAKDYVISARANNVQLDDRATVKVQRAPSTTVIRSFQPQSSTALEPVTVAFAVSSSSGSGTPAGTVTVSDGSQTCSAPVSQGACTLTPATAGNKTFKASYPGNGTFEPSSDTEQHRIDLVPTLVVALTSSLPFGSVVGQSVTFTATVQAFNGVAGGKVDFRENSCGSGGDQLGSGTLKATGDAFLSEATFTTKGLKEGIHSIFACYDGNQTFASSERGPLAQRVTRNQ